MNSFALLASILVFSLCTISSIHSRALKPVHSRSLNSIQSRSFATFQQLQRRAEEEKPPTNPICNLVIAMMGSVLNDSSLNLSEEQAKLIPNNLRRRAVEDSTCDEEFQQWFQSLTPFMESLSPEQLEKLTQILMNVSQSLGGKEGQKRHLNFQRRLLETVMDDEDED